jgi:hypothetical protein
MIRACIATLIVLTIPGAAVARLLGMKFRSLHTWAVMPALSLATIFVVAEITHVTRLPFNALTACIAVAALAVGAVVRARAEPGAVVDDAPADSDDATNDAGLPKEKSANAIALGLLGLGIGVGLLTWVHGIDGHGLVPPSSDAAYHGFFVARILDTHSIDVAKIAVSDPAGIHHLVSYYPLALHASGAVAAQLTGADIGRVLVAFTVLFAAVVLPLGMFVLARMLAPDSPLVAGFTALAVPAVALFPYAPIQFGDVPIIVGMALVPVTVVFVSLAIANGDHASRGAPGGPWDGSLIAAGLTMLTVVAVHSSQLPLVIALVALLAFERSVRARSARVLGQAVLRGLLVSAVAVVLFAPSLRSFASGVSERSGFDNTPTRALHDVIGPVLRLDAGAFGPLNTQQPSLAILAAVGVVIWLLRRRFAWVVGYGLVLAIMLLAAVSDGALSKALSLPWYRGPGRIGWNRAFFVPFFVGVAVACAVTAVATLWKNRRASLVLTSIAAVVVFGASIGYRGYDTSSALLRYSFSHDALVTRESQAAFAWLDRHVRSGDTIVNDVNQLGITTDDSVWMYAERGLLPLFGFAQSTSSGFAPPDRAAQQDLRARWFLLSHLPELGRNPRVDQLARRYRARWVYADERSLTIFRNTLNVGELLRNSHLRLAFHQGPVYVFALSS